MAAPADQHLPLVLRQGLYAHYCLALVVAPIWSILIDPHIMNLDKPLRSSWRGALLGRVIGCVQSSGNATARRSRGG
jgi:hypothetical protein